MQERGISEKQFAEKMGVSQRCLHGYLIQYRERVPFKIFIGIYDTFNPDALNVPFKELVIILPE